MRGGGLWVWFPIRTMRIVLDEGHEPVHDRVWL